MRGSHVILDIYNAKNLVDEDKLSNLLEDSVKAAEATLLHKYTFKFPGENSGVTGVAVLGESHISFHTWPEFAYVAVDLFTCGNTNIEAASNFIYDFFKTDKSQFNINILGRGDNHVTFA